MILVWYLWVQQQYHYLKTAKILLTDVPRRNQDYGIQIYLKADQQKRNHIILPTYVVYVWL